MIIQLSEGDAKKEIEDAEKEAEEEKRKKIVEEIERTESWIDTVTENGILVRRRLFREPIQADTKIEIQESLAQARDLLEDAREHLDQGDFRALQKSLSSAKFAASKAIYKQSTWWRFLNIYGGHIWIYLIGLLAAVFFIFYLNGTEPSNGSGINQSGINLATKLGVERSAINATAWGIIAAVLRAMWFLKSRVDERRYRNAWNIYFLSIPFLGGMLGSIVYLIILGGLFALSTNAGHINPLAIIPFAALAGYNWEWAITIFNKIGDLLIDGKTPLDKKSI
jgi:hypothetical protein